MWWPLAFNEVILESCKVFSSSSTTLLLTRLEETLAEKGLLRIVTFRKYFRSLVKTSRTFSEKNAADLSNLHSLSTEETFEEKKWITFLNNLFLLQVFRLWTKSFGQFVVFFLQVSHILILNIENSFRESVFFLKLVLYICFNSGEIFRFFGRPLKSSIFGIPLRNGAKRFLQEFFFQKLLSDFEWNKIQRLA